jgi:hypothetical protein
MRDLLDWRELLRDFAAFLAITAFITTTAVVVAVLFGGSS